MQTSQSLSTVLGDELQRPRAKVPLYFCGGTGANIAAATHAFIGALSDRDRANMADQAFNLVDTSRSNLTASHKGMNFVHLQKNGVAMDGGGKVMKDVWDTAKQQAPDVLKAMPPEAVNIVIASLGGGSGNALAIALTQELRRQGKEVVLVGMIGTESKAVLENITRSMTLLKDSVVKLKKTIALMPFVNESTSEYKSTNLLVAQAICMLLTIFSNQNARMDSADIVQWLNFEQRAKCDPALVGMYHTVRQAPLEPGLVPLTLATLTDNEEQDASAGWVGAYQTHGILPNPTTNEHLEASGVFSATPAHMVICDGVVQSVFNRVHELAQQVARAEQNLGRRDAIDTSAVDLDGMSA